jgi:hypothetical protein
VKAGFMVLGRPCEQRCRSAAFGKTIANLQILLHVFCWVHPRVVAPCNSQQHAACCVLLDLFSLLGCPSHSRRPICPCKSLTLHSSTPAVLFKASGLHGAQW